MLIVSELLRGAGLAVAEPPRAKA